MKKNEFKKIDAFCNNTVCQICGKDMEQPYRRTFCKNGCYEILYIDRVFSGISFFYGREVFAFTYGVDDAKKFYTKIVRRIKYWKKDYRYLAEILEGK